MLPTQEKSVFSTENIFIFTLCLALIKFKKRKIIKYAVFVFIFLTFLINKFDFGCIFKK